LLAEELKVGWDQVVIKLPDTLENINTPVTPYVSTYLQKTTFRYGTGGSSGISRRWLPLRVAGAQARELLVAAAMLTQGDTTRGNYTVANGIVSHTSGTGWSYGALVNAAATPAAQALVPYLDNPAVLLTTPAAFTVIGQKLPRPDILLKVNGAAKFGIDIFLPGMVFAAVKHCPTIGGVLTAVPARPSGALNVVPLKAYDNRGAVLKDSYNAIAIVADNSWSANKMAKSLKISWKLPTALASVDTAAIALLAKQRLANPGAGVWLAEPVVSNVASTVQTNESLVVTALANASQQVQATFSLPYVAHATMEVLNCTAQVIFSAAHRVAAKCGHLPKTRPPWSILPLLLRG
jgi:isoquinoline 1-oxidoreductase beta subunit